MTLPFTRLAVPLVAAVLLPLACAPAVAQDAPRYDLRPLIKPVIPDVPPPAGLLARPDRLGTLMLGPIPPARLQPSEDGRELVLHYSGSVPEAIFAPLESAPPEFVEFLSRGLDQVLIRFREPVRTGLVLDSQGSVLEIFPRSATPSPAAQQQASADSARRLEIARQRLRYRSGNELEARERLRQLAAQRPGDSEAALALAEVEEGLGRGRRALDAIDRALLKNPENAYLKSGRRRLARSTAMQASLSHDYQRVRGGDVQHITVLSTLVPFDDRFEFGFRGENRDLKTSDAPTPVGGTRVFNDGRQRGELALTLSHEHGGKTRAALLGGPHAAGLELSHTLYRALFRTTFTATWHRPYWDVVSGIVDGGVYDGLSIDHEHSLGPRLTANLAIGGRRYGLKGDDDVVQTGTLGLSLRYAPQTELFDLSLGYGIDGEYVNRRDIRLEGTANRFQPLAVATREIHTLDVSIGRDFGEDLRFDMFAGIGWNRYGGTGPLGGMSVTYDGLEPAVIGARISYSEATSRGDNSTALSAGGFVNWRF